MFAAPLTVVIAYPTSGVNPTHHTTQGSMAAFRGKKGKTLAQQLRTMHRKRRAAKEKYEAAKKARLAQLKAKGKK